MMRKRIKMTKKKLTKKEIAAKAKAYAKKMTQGKAMKLHALGSKAIDIAMDKPDMRTGMLLALKSYSGIDFETHEWHLEDAMSGLSPIATEIGFNEVSKLIGVRPYPQMKFDSPVAILDNVFMHGQTIAELWGEQDLDRINKMITYNYHGYDLWNNKWVPMAALWKSRAPYWIWSKVKQGLRANGININKLLGG